MDTPRSDRRFAAIVPVKRPALGKSRLATFGDAARTELVTAFAFDTVVAALDTPDVAVVLVVTDDAQLAADVRALGASVIPDGGSELNESLIQAAAELARRDPELSPVVVCADLPGLTPESLTDVLRRAPAKTPAFVPDAEGSGTTIYVAPDAARFAPRFGADSSRLHREAGALALDLPADDPARHDVDTPADLERLRAIGVGAHTRMVLTNHRI